MPILKLLEDMLARRQPIPRVSLPIYTQMRDVIPDYIRTQDPKGAPRIGDIEQRVIKGYVNRPAPKQQRYLYTQTMPQYNPQVPALNREGRPLMGWREDKTYGPIMQNKNVDPGLKRNYQSRPNPVNFF